MIYTAQFLRVFLAGMPISREMEDVLNDLFHEVIASFKLSDEKIFSNVDFAFQDLKVGLTSPAYF